MYARCDEEYEDLLLNIKRTKCPIPIAINNRSIQVQHKYNYVQINYMYTCMYISWARMRACVRVHTYVRTYTYIQYMYVDIYRDIRIRMYIRI